MEHLDQLFSILVDIWFIFFVVFVYRRVRCVRRGLDYSPLHRTEI